MNLLTTKLKFGSQGERSLKWASFYVLLALGCPLAASAQSEDPAVSMASVTDSTLNPPQSSAEELPYTSVHAPAQSTSESEASSMVSSLKTPVENSAPSDRTLQDLIGDNRAFAVKANLSIQTEDKLYKDCTFRWEYLGDGDFEACLSKYGTDFISLSKFDGEYTLNYPGDELCTLTLWELSNLCEDLGAAQTLLPFFALLPTWLVDEDPNQDQEVNVLEELYDPFKLEQFVAKVEGDEVVLNTFLTEGSTYYVNVLSMRSRPDPWFERPLPESLAVTTEHADLLFSDIQFELC